MPSWRRGINALTQLEEAGGYEIPGKPDPSSSLNHGQHAVCPRNMAHALEGTAPTVALILLKLRDTRASPKRCAHLSLDTCKPWKQVIRHYELLG